MLIKKFLFTCFIAIVFAGANACTRNINEGCEKTIQFTMDDNMQENVALFTPQVEKNKPARPQTAYRRSNCGAASQCYRN